MDLAVLRQLHDDLLAQQPSGAAHVSTDCPLCAINGTDESHPGGDELSTFTQEELDAAVAAAIAPLQTKLTELEQSQVETEVDARIAAAKAESDSRIAELQGELDSSVLKATEAERQYSDLIAFLESQQAEQEAAAELATRRDSRLELVKEVASFPDEYVTANADRWAGLSDEDFESLVNDWKAISVARKETQETGTLPKVTAMTAGRTTEETRSALSDVTDWYLQGFDPRTL
jgi:uncharacterized protein YhaN